MPIANCILPPDVLEISSGAVGLIELWKKYSGIDSSEMTITVVRGDAQFGKEYSAVCSLILPTVWSAKSVSSLQLGLSRAISEYYALETSQVIVMTSLVESGYVVEGGKEMRW